MLVGEVKRIQYYKSTIAQDVTTNDDSLLEYCRLLQQWDQLMMDHYVGAIYSQQVELHESNW